MNKADVISMLHDAIPILNDLGVYWWVSAGTALGIHRDGFSDTFIEHDTDIDIGVFQFHFTQARNRLREHIAEAFIKNGFTLYRTYQKSDFTPQIVVVKYDTLLDMYFFIEERDILVNHNEFGMMIKPKFLIEHLTNTTILGDIVVPMPNPIESYLELRYGRDWKVPAKEKRGWWMDCNNLVKYGPGPS